MKRILKKCVLTVFAVVPELVVAAGAVAMCDNFRHGVAIASLCVIAAALSWDAICRD